MDQPDQPSDAKPRIVRCPACGGDSVYAPTQSLPPVLLRSAARTWISALGPARISGCRTKPPPDDEPFGDPKLQ